MTLEECQAAGVPVYHFGSKALADLHEDALDPPLLVGFRGEGRRLVNGAWEYVRCYPVYQQTYGWKRAGFEYVVDHGGFYTLNRIQRGQVVPRSEFIR